MHLQKRMRTGTHAQQWPKPKQVPQVVHINIRMRSSTHAQINYGFQYGGLIISYTKCVGTSSLRTFGTLNFVFYALWALNP